MPSIKPRVNVVLTERQDQVLEALSLASGKSKSDYVRRVLTAALPLLEGLLMVEAKTASYRLTLDCRLVEELNKLFEPSNDEDREVSRLLGTFHRILAGDGRRPGDRPAALGSAVLLGDPPTLTGGSGEPKAGTNVIEFKNKEA